MGLYQGNSLAVVHRVCKAKGIRPDVLLAHLLDMLGSAHMLATTRELAHPGDGPFTEDADEDGDDTCEECEAPCEDEDDEAAVSTVVNLLDGFIAFGDGQLKLLLHEQNPPDVPVKQRAGWQEMLQSHLAKSEALRLMLRECVNEAEHAALALSLETDPKDKGKPS